MLECENMRGDTIQKPSVVADHHRASGEIFQSFLQSPGNRIGRLFKGTRLLKIQADQTPFGFMGQAAAVTLENHRISAVTTTSPQRPVC